MRACAFDGGCDAAGQVDVIVLDENGVEKARAMIRGAARPDGVLFQHPQRRGRLPRVEDRDGSAARLDEPARARGDAREPLKKIERGAFADEQRPRRTEKSRACRAIPSMSSTPRMHRLSRR